MASLWRESQPLLRATPGGKFWIDWYQRALDGGSQNWPLLRDVALIDIAVRREGGAALDREIARISERHRLLEDVRRLKAGLAEARFAAAAIAHRGHNQPPELLSDFGPEIAVAVAVISDQLDQAERELQKRQLSPARLNRIGLAIRGAVASVLACCAGLSDEMLKGATKEFGAVVGKWAGLGVVAYVVAQNQTFRELADALIRFAGF